MVDSLKGRIFNIQKFSLHDGPGIRDLVFLKGCPLRCTWCSNPESQQVTPELFFRRDRCIGVSKCGLCIDACHEKAILASDNDSLAIERSACTYCEKCVDICPALAFEIVGKNMTVDDVLVIVEQDSGFHTRSEGGLTVSGGEPLVQVNFVASLFRECKKRGVDTAVETSGFGKWEQVEKMCQDANSVYYDIKSIDANKHETFTGVSNSVILANLQRLTVRFPQKRFIVRTPIIPGFNDAKEDITNIASFLKKLKIVKKYELLPFHRFGSAKYQYLGQSSPFDDIKTPDEDKMQELRKASVIL